MSEQLKHNGEIQDTSPQELESAAQERQHELKEQRDERAGEKSPEQNAEALKNEAFEQAKKHEVEQTEAVVSPAEKRKDSPLPRTKAGKNASFNKTMGEARSHMSPTSRAFSKVIHNKAVEKTSDAVGSTVARPNALLSGAFTAFILTLAVYLVAKYYGYPLSGFESIGAFIAGWVIGLLFDYLRVMITGKKA